MAKTKKESPDYYRTLDRVEITRCDPALSVERDRAIRLYCTQRGTTWLLQLRAPLTLTDGREGKDYMLAGASMSREDLLALRVVITAALAVK